MGQCAHGGKFGERGAQQPPAQIYVVDILYALSINIYSIPRARICMSGSCLSFLQIVSCKCKRMKTIAWLFASFFITLYDCYCGIALSLHCACESTRHD